MGFRSCLLLCLLLLGLNAEAVQRSKNLLPDYSAYLAAETIPSQSYNELLVEPFPICMMKRTFYERLAPKYQKLLFDFGHLQILGVTSIGVLWMLPRQTTNWDLDYILGRGFFQNWVDNVTNPPVIDKDHWAVNYIGHGLGGAFYHTLARSDDLNIAESFLFNFAVSTFYWEYGFEAFFEKPSIQDLIITPLVGSLVGEGFYQLMLKIKANEGKVLGSKFLGSLSMVLMNPEGALATFMENFFHTYKDTIDIKMVNYFSSFYNVKTNNGPIAGLSPIIDEGYFGVIIDVKF